jgi:hypothetical protein
VFLIGFFEKGRCYQALTIGLQEGLKQGKNLNLKKKEIFDNF